MKKQHDFSKGKRGALISKSNLRASPKIQEVVDGIRYKIAMLERILEGLKSNPKGVERVIDDHDGRLDELKTLLNWIEE